jgi:hypothetical protein
VIASSFSILMHSVHASSAADGLSLQAILTGGDRAMPLNDCAMAIAEAVYSRLGVT